MRATRAAYLGSGRRVDGYLVHGCTLSLRFRPTVIESETFGCPAAVYATLTLSVVSSHAAPRLSTGVCTMTELTGVANAADPQAALTAVLGSNEPCGKCILACLSSGADDPTPCLLDCTGTSTAGGTTTAPATITTSSGARTCMPHAYL